MFKAYMHHWHLPIKSLSYLSAESNKLQSFYEEMKNLILFPFKKTILNFQSCTFHLHSSFEEGMNRRDRIE